jgi:hypothetical protein
LQIAGSSEAMRTKRGTVLSISPMPAKFKWRTWRIRDFSARFRFHSVAKNARDVLRLLRHLDVIPKTQKSLPISGPILAKNVEKHSVKLADARVASGDFCILLIGAPRGARKSKSKKRG